MATPGGNVRWHRHVATPCGNVRWQCHVAMPGGNAPGGDARGKQDRGNTRWQCQSFRYCGTGPAQGSISHDLTFDVGAEGHLDIVAQGQPRVALFVIRHLMLGPSVGQSVCIYHGNTACVAGVEAGTVQGLYRKEGFLDK